MYKLLSLLFLSITLAAQSRDMKYIRTNQYESYILYSTWVVTTVTLDSQGFYNGQVYVLTQHNNACADLSPAASQKLFVSFEAYFTNKMAITPTLLHYQKSRNNISCAKNGSMTAFEKIDSEDTKKEFVIRNGSNVYAERRTKEQREAFIGKYAARKFEKLKTKFRYTPYKRKKCSSSELLLRLQVQQLENALNELDNNDEE